VAFNAHDCFFLFLLSVWPSVAIKQRFVASWHWTTSSTKSPTGRHKLCFLLLLLAPPGVDTYVVVFTGSWRNIAFSERNKLAQELEESRRVLDSTKAEREKLVKRLEEAVRVSSGPVTTQLGGSASLLVRSRVWLAPTRFHDCLCLSDHPFLFD